MNLNVLDPNLVLVCRWKGEEGEIGRQPGPDCGNYSSPILNALSSLGKYLTKVNVSRKRT